MTIRFLAGPGVDSEDLFFRAQCTDVPGYDAVISVVEPVELIKWVGIWETLLIICMAIIRRAA